MPLRYLFEPWTAPRAVQEKANCVIGVDYPTPMVEHQKASKHCYNLMMEVRNKLLKTNKGMPMVDNISLTNDTLFCQAKPVVFLENWNLSVKHGKSSQHCSKHRKTCQCCTKYTKDKEEDRNPLWRPLNYSSVFSQGKFSLQRFL